MSARRVSAAAGVVRAAIGRGQQAPGIAYALESAGLLQSPETAAELTALRNGALNTPMSGQRLAEILARAKAATPGPWCTDAWEIYQGTEYEPGFSAWIGETCRGTSTPEQDRADASFVAAARTDVPELVAAVQLLTAEVDGLRTRVAELEAQRDRRRVRLVALQNDALNVRGALSPNGEPRKVPMPLGETLAPAVEWLLGRVAELEAAASAVRGQHYEVDGSPDGDGYCIQCGSTYPCATRLALAVDTPVELVGEDPGMAPHPSPCRAPNSPDCTCPAPAIVAIDRRIDAQFPLLAALRAEDAHDSIPDPLAYGPTGYRCGCGKDAHSNLTPCQPMTADEWNARYPVGTPVVAYPGSRDGRHLDTVTRTPAWTLGHGAAVVSVEGESGGICLTHVDPVSGGAS
ncbi:hypothetical protein ACFRCI_09605 [Streptomyces sp. NPDC056638]|uniref:hypothetical protein n=1 Tax=Streptomyces sp. NPDC056638 TaxID=3345887 RepID=UPI0036940058